ncbi:ATP-binding protein [Streptomyces sp. NBC_00378]|uniref:ATP-binding protein n=1 Tax=unclassified Streptomyces TaxID=2593676 RepID=UPI00224DE79E|nr:MULTISPECIES: ATP-binding protein [unclassified Streptomyces]MCX5112185.1 ATP-binding protein [Streptomyces sp. NBC_00378]MCX5114620.1 ATP-binding protein [Streptomyces sp. NBC_00378]
MSEPTTGFTGNPNATLGRILAGLHERHPHLAPGPVDDAPTPDEPGHPEYHRRRRAEWNLGRWEVATPPRYRRADATHPAVQQWADAVAAAPDTAGSLLLTGTTGTGKTHQAYGAFRRIAAAGSTHPYEIRALTAADMNGLLRVNGSPRGVEEELRRLCRIPLLLLDDLGSAKATEWTEETTYRLINERYNTCKPTLYTSNLPAKADDGRDLTAALGDRIVSRLSEDTAVVAMTGPDRRRAA